MTFTDSIGSMGTVNNAAKRPNMIGYIWRTTDARNGLSALTDEQIAAGGFRVTFVQRDGDQFIYTYNGTTEKFTYEGFVVHGENYALGTGNVVPATPLTFDQSLMTHIAIGNNWSTGKQSDYEGVRVPTGGEEW